MHRDRALAGAIILTLVVVALVFVLKKPAFAECRGTARCFADNVSRVIDGDTIAVGERRIRLVLVDTPEHGEAGFDEATKFTSDLCLGRRAIVDQDDFQLYDDYGRMLGVVYCNGTNVNAELLEKKLGVLYKRFCEASEFGTAEWARRAGC